MQFQWQRKLTTYIHFIFEVIEAISDKEYQNRVWIRGEGPEVDDFDETTNNFFQDGDRVIERYEDFELSSEQYDQLVRFRKEFKAFCNGPALECYLPQLFIDTPEWTKITDLAKDVLKSFNYHN